jgi:hypothetical protein
MIKEIKDKTRLQITAQGYEQNLDIEVRKDFFLITVGSEEIALDLEEAKFFINTMNEMLESAHDLK